MKDIHTQTHVPNLLNLCLFCAKVNNKSIQFFFVYLFIIANNQIKLNVYREKYVS